MNILGFIPARGGSKRVPYKNIHILNGKPLIFYTIRASKLAKKIDRLILSTEDEKIAQVAKEYGCDVPFIRPLSLAQDSTPDKPVIEQAVRWMEENEDYFSDIIVILRPTTPFKTPEIIDAVIQKLIDDKSDSVRTVTRVEANFHPYWMFRKDEFDRAQPLIKGKTIEKYYQRQLLPPVYRLNGVVDAIRTETLKHSKKLYGVDTRLFEIEEKFAIDIDDEQDFEYCEYLMKKKD